MQDSNESEKSSTLDVASSGTRSDDGKHEGSNHPMKTTLFSSEEESAWPTLGQSQEQSTKKKGGKNSSVERRGSLERAKKNRQHRGVPLPPEEQDKLFHHEKSERIVKEKRINDRERTHQRNNSVHVDLKSAQNGNKTKNISEQESLTTGSESQSLANTGKYSRGRGRSFGKGGGTGYGRGRNSNHMRSYSHDNSNSTYNSMGPPFRPLMYPPHPVPMISPVYYPPGPYAPVPFIPGMMYSPGLYHPPVQMAGFTRQQVLDAIRKQIEYYFSTENLEKDQFLRSKMDNDGWISLYTIMSFNRVRSLTLDPRLVVEAICSSSETVEVSEDMNFVRAKKYEQWILPISKQHLAHIPTNNLKAYVPVSPLTHEDFTNHDEVFQLDEEHNENAQETTNEKKDLDFDNLKVLLQFHGQRKNSIDMNEAALINEGLAHYQQQIHEASEISSKRHFYSSSVPKNSSKSCNRRSLDDSHARPSASVGWILSKHSACDPEVNGCSSYKDGTYLGSSVPHFDHPGHTHLKNSNFKQMSYNQFYARCLKDRSTKGIGKSEEMDVLYRFWSFFLRENFNETMYSDFKRISVEDEEKDARYGIESLFCFFSYGLEKNFNEKLYEDFENLALTDYNNGHLYGLEKFWAFHHYGGIPKDSNVHVNLTLKKLIDNHYSSLDDFHRKPRGEVGSCHIREPFQSPSPSSTLSSAAERNRRSIAT